MASLGLRSSGGITLKSYQVIDRVKSPSSQKNRVRLAPTMAANCSAIQLVQERTHNYNMTAESEKLDRWVKESVGEIVKNLQEAPLFVHVYSEPGTKLKTEKAIADDWSHLKGRWVKGEEPSPEGIILVEELKEGEMGILEEVEGQTGDSTKAFGVLIQGKGEDGGVACYLLKTSKVGCGNLGLFCTHFCLVRVKSFRESARSQLNSCWLV
ncbi:uncharacterized protein LOC130818915 [Amaranthus tricolor]|uniref:uncharacterized protein LOC130818915 n=1 Tax=Amaranthus tricolor TaxID=29722 RepID=UPI002585820E|nr:uncharacterized protein LOC130818915 [Amaranthus tricolor]